MAKKRYVTKMTIGKLLQSDDKMTILIQLREMLPKIDRLVVVVMLQDGQAEVFASDFELQSIVGLLGIGTHMALSEGDRDELQ